MPEIEVNLLRDRYVIQIGAGLLEQVGSRLMKMSLKDKAVIITNPAIKELYGKSMVECLKKAGLHVALLEVPEGEESKSLEQAGRLYNLLSKFQAERLTPVLALGGGVIGDLAGFVSATYMRGIPLIQIPTTLLAQVDSSIGGKTAVNHGGLKNNIGVFYQPSAVFSDVLTLRSLPLEELENGIAEIIKYGIIRDRDLFSFIGKNLEALKSRDEGFLIEIISRCAAIKAAIVAGDEGDLGLRNILNLGHTVGHAIESVSDFRISHGRSISVGMVAAGLISCRMGILTSAELKQIKDLIILAGLPVRIPGLNITGVLQAMKHDKKNLGGRMRFILPLTIGEVFICDDVQAAVVEQVLKDL